MYTIKDPVFGKLERHGQSWRGSYWFEALQRNIEVNLSYKDEDSPHEKEQASFLNFKTQIGLIFPAFEKALFHFLTENTEFYRQKNDVWEQESSIPNLKNIVDVWEILEIMHIEIDSENYQNICITLICDFKWEVEHGLDIDFYNNRIGISEGGTHWDDKTHYDFEGNLIK
jgi:hypothetical protein